MKQQKPTLENELDALIFDFQQQVRLVTGGDRTTAVDVTEIKQKFRTLITAAKEEGRQEELFRERDNMDNVIAGMIAAAERAAYERVINDLDPNEFHDPSKVKQLTSKYLTPSREDV